MGMTIDDNVDFLNEAKDFFEDIANDPKIKESIKIYLIIESLEMAMSTIRKYQKIETIIEMWKEDRKRFTLGDNGSKDEYLRQISEVLEDGNDDC